MSYFGGHWYPCLGFLMTSSLCFKVRVGYALFAFFAEVNVMYFPRNPPTRCQPLVSHHCGAAILRWWPNIATYQRTPQALVLGRLAYQLRIEDHFGFCTFWTKFCNISKYGINLKFETIVQFFRKIMQLNAVIILKSTNEYYQKIISKSGRKMDLYLAMPPIS